MAQMALEINYQERLRKSTENAIVRLDVRELLERELQDILSASRAEQAIRTGRELVDEKEAFVDCSCSKGILLALAATNLTIASAVALAASATVSSASPRLSLLCPLNFVE